MLAQLFVAIQYILPRHWLTALVYRIARIRVRPIKNALIHGFVRIYNIDHNEVAKDIPQDYKCFNDFFTRELADGSRVIDHDRKSIVSPVDGTVSIAAQLQADRLVQAKGLDYTLDDLFAIDLDEARRYVDGSFVTIYLAPYNYHRVHMPFDGTLVAAHYVPGDLFSVNSTTVARVRGLFRRNERLNLHFETAFGPAAVIFVGALNVGSITTPWTGEIRPRKSGVVESQSLGAAPTTLTKGDLLGWFNMGSTVILVLPEGVSSWDRKLVAETTLQMGETIGTYMNTAK